MNSFRNFGIVLIMLLMCVSCGTTKKAEANSQADNLYGQKLDIDSLELNYVGMKPMKPLLILPSGSSADIIIAQDRYYVKQDNLVTLYALSSREKIGVTEGEKCKFSADGNYLVVQADSSFTVFRTKDFDEVFSIAQEVAVELYGISPFEDAWIGCSNGNTVFINPKDGRIIRTLDGQPVKTRKGKAFGEDIVKRMYSPKGKYFFTKSGEKLILYKTDCWNKVFGRDCFRHRMDDCFAVSDNEEYLVFRDDTKDEIRRVNMDTLEEEFVSDSGPNVYDFYGDLMCILIDDPTVIPSYENRYDKSRVLKVMDYVTGDTLSILNHEAVIAFCGFLDGRRLLSYSRGLRDPETDNHRTMCTMWDYRTGEKINYNIWQRETIGLPTDGRIYNNASIAILFYGSGHKTLVQWDDSDNLNVVSTGLTPGSGVSCSDIVERKKGDQVIYYQVPPQ